MSEWVKRPPYVYDLVTGFFPETSPKGTWATNPRPLLVCGRAENAETGMVICRVAYGTTQLGKHCHDNDLVVGNLSLLNQLNLKRPTRFVIHSGRQMVNLPWTEEFFRPWTGKTSPVLGTLPEDMQRYVGSVLSQLDDLPDY